MCELKDLSIFDQGLIVMASPSLGTQYLSKVVQGRNCCEPATGPCIDAHGEQRLACVVQSNRQATVAKIAELVSADSDRKVSE